MAQNSHFRLPALRHLVLPPLVERELRGAARRPSFFWLRGVLALAVAFQACELLDRYAIAPPLGALALMAAAPGPAITGAAVFHQMSWLLFLAVLLMGLLSADSVARERREGTLGLLLLTDLTPAEIVRGKMLSYGLTSFLALLGCLPALMLPVLAGGVTGSQAAFTAIGLLNTLFVALAAGLWMSTVFRERRHAMPATLGLVAALAFGPEVLGGSFFGPSAVPVFRFFGLAGWMTSARGPLAFIPIFVCWFALTHALGWVLLRCAAGTLAATWQDQPHKHFREPEPAEAWPSQLPAYSLRASAGREERARTSPSPPLEERVGERRPGTLAENDGLLSLPLSSKGGEGNGSAAPPVMLPSAPALALARASWLTDPRPWDADPIRWRVERLGPAEGLIWLALALNFFAQFGTLGSMFGVGTGPVDTWGLLSFVGLVVILFSGGLLAWVGARFFQDTRRQQDLELLLTTPLGGRNILAGQWQVLRRALAWPVGLVLALALPAGIALLYDFVNGDNSEPWFLLQPFLIAVNLALEAVALCWVGMWFGLRARNLMTAVAGAMGLAQLLPLALAVGLMWSCARLPGIWTPHAMSRGRMPPVILALLFFAGKNVVLILWARFRLRRELRLRHGTARRDASAHRLVPQRA